MRTGGAERAGVSFTADVAVAAAFVLGLWLISRSYAPQVVELRTLHLTLLFGAALLAGGIAIIGTIGARTLRHPRPAWVGAAFALDGAIVLPLSALGSATVAESPGFSALAITAEFAMVALLGVARHPPLRVRTAAPWLAGFACAIVALLMGVAGDRWPSLANGLTSPAVAFALGLSWALSATAFVVNGVREHERPRWRIGLGLWLIAVEHLDRVIDGTGPLAPDLLPTTLHVIGLLGVLSGSAIRVHGEMSSLISEFEQQQLELSETALHARRAAALAAERDHELANGLAGLSGIALLLGQPGAGKEGPHLRSVVLAELSRLNELLARSPTTTAQDAYDAAAVVTELAALRRLAGMDIEVTTNGPLPVNGRRNAFAQVITNLLANCERHAPGAAVHIQAMPCESHAVIDICDDGPGIPETARELVLQRGVSLGPRRGQGLGLDVSARLLAAQGGSLHILPRRPDQRGFAVRLELPLAERTASTRETD